MFTVAQIKEAHSKVKSGADFPKFIAEIKQLGVTYYEAFVSDGHIDYNGANDYKTSAPAKYEPIAIAPTSDKVQFETDLRAHQQGKTDYPQFCLDCAHAGVEKWAVCFEAMTCTYFDSNGTIVWVEEIPV